MKWAETRFFHFRKGCVLLSTSDGPRKISTTLVLMGREGSEWELDKKKTTK